MNPQKDCTLNLKLTLQRPRGSNTTKVISLFFSLSGIFHTLTISLRGLRLRWISRCFYNSGHLLLFIWSIFTFVQKPVLKACLFIFHFINRYHAAHLTNCGEYEELAREAGKISGDMTFPLVYTPELHFCEFESAVADMKNSVKV